MTSLHAAPITVDFAAERLWIGERPVELRPKTWQVLCQLLASPGDLVTKDELLDHVWAETAVTEGTLNKSIGELRLALGDTSQNSQCIETVPRRGFRWIGAARLQGATIDTEATATQPALWLTSAEATELPALNADAIIARDAELAQLTNCLERARAGQRQLVFVSGEAGAGKTTLVDRFLEAAQRGSQQDTVLVAYGQCIETAGEHEPYLPILQAVDRLAREQDAGESVLTALRHCAPTWMTQLGSLSDGAAASSERGGATGRMLRELMAAVEQIASKRTLILLVEDMHWADFATTDLCHALARERSPAAVLVIVTMRSAEAMVRDHPISSLRRDLVTKGLAEEIALAPFESGALSDYLAARCPGLDQHANLGDRLLEQTAGNPLFVRLVVDEWIASGRVLLGNDGRWGPAGDPEELDRTVPDSVRFLLDGQIAQLDAEQRAVLEAGSLHGGDFHATSIAGVLGEDPERVEEICRSISRRRQLLGYGGRVATGNGSMAEQYGFLHATVRRVVANGIQSSRRRRLHRAFAEQLRSEHAGRTFAISSQLAVHDEAAGDIPNAVQSLRDSAKLAMRRDSPKDAVVILERVLTLLDENPETPDNDGERVLALSYLSHAHQLAHGFGAPQVAALWSRTRELAGSIQDAREQAVADAGRIMVCCVTARYADAEEVIREALPKLDDNVDEGGRQALMFSAATVRYRVGALDDAALLFESALALKNASDPVPGADLVAVLMSQYAPVLVLSGRTEAARRMVRESVERARAHSHYSECVTSTIAAWALGLLHDYAGAVPIAARAFELAEADNYRTWMTRPQFLLGIAAMREGRIEEGLTKVRAAIETRESEGQLVDHSAHLCLLADALMDAGQEGAGEILDKAQAFVASSGELFAECDVYRLRAKERRLSGADAEEVEALLRRAIKLAVLRDMHWHRLLAARDLATLFFGLGRDDEARATLEPALGLVESGPEVRAASQLLNR